MKVIDVIDNLYMKNATCHEPDPEIRFFIINEHGEKVQVFLEDISVSQEGVEVLLG